MAEAAKEPSRNEPRVALVAGASGLTGSALLPLLLREEGFARVLALSRRPLPMEHARLANRILKFDEMERSLKGQRCTDAFCALGAPGGPLASEAQLREVDLRLATGTGALQTLKMNEVDVVIRRMAAGHGDPQGTPFLSGALVAVCAPELLERHPVAAAADVAHHPLIEAATGSRVLFAPRRLADLARELLVAGPPSRPLDTGI